MDVPRSACTAIALLFFVGWETWERIKGAYEGYPRWAEFIGGWLVIILLPAMGLFFQAIPWAEKKEIEIIPESFEEE